MIIVCLKILDRAHFLPNIGSGAETRSQYQGLCQALDEYTRKTFYEWTQTVDKVEHFYYYIIQSCYVSRRWHRHRHHPASASVLASVHTSPWYRVIHRNFIFGIPMHMCPPYMHIKYLVILMCSF